MLPLALRSAIWNSYDPGQETRKRASPEYLNAAKEAIDWLVENERSTHD